MGGSGGSGSRGSSSKKDPYIRHQEYMQRFYDREARQEGKLLVDRLKNEQRQQNEHKKSINLYKDRPNLHNHKSTMH